jgi:hypothetical protein
VKWLGKHGLLHPQTPELLALGLEHWSVRVQTATKLVLQTNCARFSLKYPEIEAMDSSLLVPDLLSEAYLLQEGSLVHRECYDN